MTTQSPESANGESKKPKDTPFSQQKLPAWQPILTAGTVLPAFFVIGVAFVAIGAGLLYFTNGILEHEIDYTDCINTLSGNGEPCHEVIKNDTDTNCKCEVTVTINQTWTKPVYLYYGLTNFYQNHRRYVKSRDEQQLLGNIEKAPADDCKPYALTKNNIPIVPCGAIANSLFNDVITLKDPDNNSVNLTRTGIAWASDKTYKFKNPEFDTSVYPSLEDYLKNKTSKPTDWKKNLWELDTEDPSNNGLENEDLIVWMRTAAFPNFRKLYRIINEDLKEGKYTFSIDYNYKVKPFSGTKSVVLSQISILGGKNSFLPISYIVVGTLCLLIGVVFLFIHVKYGKLSGDLLVMENRN